MILKDTLDQLMKKVRGNEFVYVCSGEVGCVRLIDLSFDETCEIENHIP